MLKWRKNKKIENMLHRLNIQNCLKAKRVGWVGYVWKTKEKLIHKILIKKPSERKLNGRPHQR